MSVLKYFKNIPRSPSHRATGPKCNFFSPNLQRSPWRKKRGPVAPPTGDRGACRPPLGRPMGPAHERGRGACRPPLGRPGYSPLYNLQPSHSLLFWVRKFHPKSRKKERSEEKESGEALPDSALVICRLVHLIYIFLYLSNTYLSRSNLSRGE